MKKNMILITTIIMTQASLHAESWWKTNWEKVKHKFENAFDKTKKSTPKADAKTKPTHDLIENLLHV